MPAFWRAEGCDWVLRGRLRAAVVKAALRETVKAR
jgi:hypothetical protein